MEKIALSVTEMAKELGISRSVAYALVHRKDFPAARIGDRFIIYTDGLREWLKNGGTEARHE